MFSVVICTYNRAEILTEVLDHMIENADLKHVTEILIVDNNSKDNTHDVVDTCAKKCHKIKYVLEEQQGLSFARNRGAQESTAEFVYYLDDDALVDKDLFNTSHEILGEDKCILALGGSYIPWYRYGRPFWYKDEYASMRFKFDGLHELSYGVCWTGGVFTLKRELFEKYGYFDTDLGMKGGATFYGEETELQLRLNSNGVKVFGSNDLLIKHVVQDYKLNIGWFFKMKKNIGISTARIDSRWPKIIEIPRGLIIGLGQAIVFPFMNVGKLFTKNYYIQNFLIDSFSKPYKWLWFSIEQFKT